MTKFEYLESQRGKTYSVIVAEQPTETAIGSIRGDNLRDVVDILAKGLQDRLDKMALPEAVEPVRTALVVVFRYLTLANYQINLSIAENAALLQNAVSAGLVLQAEADKFVKLASYQKPLYGVTREDCAEYFGTDWNELPETDGSSLVLQLNSRTPEPTHVVVQVQDLSGEWEHVTALHGIQSAKGYFTTLPYYGQPRKVRWKCEYQLNGSVSVS